MPGSGSPATGQFVGIWLSFVVVLIGLTVYEAIAETLHWWPTL